MSGKTARTTPATPIPAIDIRTLQVIHSGARHTVYHAPSDRGRSQVIKLPAPHIATAQAVASLRHEYDLLRDLDLPGVVRATGLAQTSAGLALLMDHAGDGNLGDVLRAGSLPISDFFDLAVQLAQAVVRLHKAQIVHRDLNPGNFVWNAQDRRITIADFAVATTLPALAVESTSPHHLEGTLAYISPEQTGRTGRLVDSRTDLYSLGAAFYEMLVGRPPFVSDDPVALVHAHIARHPLAPHEASPDIPPALSQIVMKLLRKEPEQRYQTAEALVSDLGAMRSQWLGGKTLVPFPLGLQDEPRALSITGRLYGRGPQVEILREAFARARHGSCELVLVTGAPGVGKSALVGQLAPDIIRHRGLHISGKFDQLQRGVPFSGLSQGFRDLARQLLMEPAEALAQWRDSIAAAVAPNGQVLIDVVPELERIIGPQPKVQEFGPVESKNRFHMVFTQFLGVFAWAEHPLVLFLDDLQWADTASLQLIEQWLGGGAGHHFLLLGAYRDGEVGPTHPLTHMLDQLHDVAFDATRIHLAPIGADDVAQLVADTLGNDPIRARPLAELIMRKTAGNPFFVRQLLHLLHAEGLIRFAPAIHGWEWDLARVDQAPLADNVLDLMVHAIARLPAATRRLLETAACIGYRFDLRMLAEIAGLTRAAVTDELWPALNDGLLLPLGSTYKASRSEGPLEASLDALPTLVRFAHDRVQQAAYSMLGDQDRRERHLRIGRHLLRRAARDRLDEALFDIVDQLDLGEALIADPAERLRLAELNLAAGGKARASGAYQAAIDYLTVAMRNLPDDAWRDHPALAFAVHRECAECAYLTGRHDRAEDLIERALDHAPSRIARTDLHSLRVLAATVVGDWPQALRWGREGLAVFGQEWPIAGLAQAGEAEADAVLRHLGARPIADLAAAGEVTDEETRACMRLLSLLGPPAYFSGAPELTFLVARATNLSLVHGPSVYSAFAYALHAAIHNARSGEYDVGYAFGRAAQALARRFCDRAEESRAVEVFGLVVHPWKAPLRDSLPLLREGYRAGVESGELAYAAFNLNSLLINSLPAGVPLADLRADADAAMEFATRHKNRTSSEMALPFRQLCRALMGETAAPAAFNDDTFDEARFLEAAAGNQTALGFFWTAKLQAAFLLGDHVEALHLSAAGEAPVLAGNLGMVTTADHAFYTALALAAGPTGAASLDALRTLHARLAGWAAHCPANFAHKAALIAAEIARFSGDFAAAMAQYRQAIDGSAGFVQDQAIAHERRAGLLLDAGEPDLAAVHLRAARDRYRQWGASVKVRALETRHPDVFAAPRAAPAGRVSIDALALIKVSQAISAERDPERLAGHILRVIAEVAGAQSGSLVLCDKETLTLRARVAMAEDDAVVFAPAPTWDEAQLPATILRYVLRMKEPLVLADAAAQGAFVRDPAVQAGAMRSVLCVPIINQAEVLGLLTLEHASMAGAFTDDLVETVRVLAAQAAISLENATLLASLQDLTAALEERVTERTRQLADEIAARDRAEAALLQSQKMEAMGSLTGGVAHDFNNLLTPILGSLDLLQRKSLGGEREQRLIAGAVQSADRAKTLVQRLLAFARRQPLQTAAVDVETLVTGMADLIRSTSGPQIRVVVDAGADLPPAQIDANQLEMALLNLSVNARDAMPDGGTLRITVSAEHASPNGGPNEEKALKPGHYIRLSVADTGVGMDEATLARAVEPFFSTKGIGKGTGLGLSMAHGLASQLGGALTIQSRPGAGTTIELWLPVSESLVERASPQVRPAAPRRSQGIALLVDDEELVRMTTAHMLQDLGYTVVEAESGEDALRQVRAGVIPDILVTDHLMPGMTGEQLARTLRAGHPGMHALLVSGYAEIEGVAQDLPRLVKPFRINELSTSLAALRESPEPEDQR